MVFIDVEIIVTEKTINSFCRSSVFNHSQRKFNIDKQMNISNEVLVRLSSLQPFNLNDMIFSCVIVINIIVFNIRVKSIIAPNHNLEN